MDLRDVRDRHDARDDRDLDADGAGALDEAEVRVGFEEQLRDEKLCAALDLLLEAPQIRIEIGRLEMLLRIRRTGDAERVAALDEARELLRVPEAALGPDEVRLAAWR